jgi:bacterioferritin-associated ferredoxin
MSKLGNKLRVEFAQCDLIEAYQDSSGWHLQARGCSDLLKLLKSCHRDQGADIAQWPLPVGLSHAEMLVRELILKAQNRWQYPYHHEELCHCRTVLTKRVDEAILMGAHRSEIVSRQTSASTACGTCRPDVEKIIEYRLGVGR